MWTHLKKEGMQLPEITSEEIDEKLKPVLLKMHVNGVKIDTKVFNDLAEKFEKRLMVLEEEIYKLTNSDFNIGSPSQMADVLFNKLQLPTNGLKKTKSGFSTAASELSKIQDQHPVINNILEYRELSKLVSTYLRPLPLLVDADSRLHTTYGTDTNTGRLTSSNPNLQNIPIKGEIGREIRQAFAASSGYNLISADYSQIELRVVACLSDDKAMKEAFMEGQDIHARTAAEIFNKKIEEITSDERRIAKTVNFGVLYGMSPYGLSQSLGIDQSAAADFINRYFTVHAGIKEYCDRVTEWAKDKGYVETLFGLKRPLPNIKSKFRNVAESECRMAVNSPVQGTAAEILKLAMIELNKRLDDYNKNHDDETRLLLTIHDELVIEVSESNAKEVAGLVKDVMEKAVSLCVPIEADVKIGQNWGSMERYSS